MVTLLGLGAALTYGAADFFGGAAARRAGTLAALMISVPVGLFLLAMGALGTGAAPTVGGLAWGLAAGTAGGAGMITFYRALARGPMSVVAPVSALAAAVVPVAVGALRGERLNAPALVGVLLCLVAIGLVSMEESASPIGPRRPATGSRLRRIVDSGPVVAAFSGATFGVFFVLIREAGTGSGLWPLVSARTGNVVVLVVAMLLTRRRVSVPKGSTLLLAVCSGALDAGANLLYFLATHAGLLSLAAVLTSLYPAVTVLLARAVYCERLRLVQRIGMGIALAGIALVTAG
jgi:uncharacterized membrane protein